MSESEQVQEAVINIKVTDDSVKYDTNLAIPDVVFWLETVKSMILQEALGVK